MFFAFDIMFMFMMVLFFIFFAFTIVRAVKQRNYNRSQPRLVVEANVVTKRGQTMHNGNMHSTRYYVTFQVESGDQLEFMVSAQEYGMLVEGDQGKLQFQGNQYLGFERK